MEAESDSATYFNFMKESAVGQKTDDLFNEFADFDSEFVREVFTDFCKVPKKEKAAKGDRYQNDQDWRWDL